MAMLAAVATAERILPPHNGRRRAVNKQRYGCAPTEDLCLCRIVWLLFLVTVTLS